MPTARSRRSTDILPAAIRSRFAGEEEQDVQTRPTTGTSFLGFERSCSSHPDPATALRWSGDQPGKAIRLLAPDASVLDLLPRLQCIFPNRYARVRTREGAELAQPGSVTNASR